MIEPLCDSRPAAFIWREMVAACEDQHIKSYNNMKKRTFRVFRKSYRKHFSNHESSIHSLVESVLKRILYWPNNIHEGSSSSGTVTSSSLPQWNWKRTDMKSVVCVMLCDTGLQTCISSWWWFIHSNIIFQVHTCISCIRIKTAVIKKQVIIWLVFLFLAKEFSHIFIVLVSKLLRIKIWPESVESMV